MKKILLIQFMLLMPLMAETGSEQAIGASQIETCTLVRQKAYQSYEVFQMNARCSCKQTETKEWSCEIVFSHMGKRAE